MLSTANIWCRHLCSFYLFCSNPNPSSVGGMILKLYCGTLLWVGHCCWFAGTEKTQTMFHQIVDCLPAVKFLGMFLPHCVKTVGDRGILSRQHDTVKGQTQNWKVNTSSCVTYSWETHHSDREVVVDEFIGHWVALLLILIWDDLHTPAVHQHLRAPLDVFKNTTQILSVVSFKKKTQHD